MNLYTDEEKVKLINSLFKGRNDVFAIYWKRGNKSGYMPAYEYDPYLLRLHKLNGGSFKDYQDKTYQPFSSKQVLKHLKGEKSIGIYPLLQNNTSWFIAADFDKENWSDECTKLINVCKEYNISAYLERSRSGKGGHVWVFFEEPYPAAKSRKIMTFLLKKSGIISVFDKGSSFDRLFPNQDFHSGKGLGNLIALPFNKQSIISGNSCFVDSNLIPYQDQWKTLSSVKRVPISSLESIYRSFNINKSSASTFQILSNVHTDKFSVHLNNFLCVSRSGITNETVSFLTDELNLTNSDYYQRKNTGKSTFGIPKYFKFIEETENWIFVPRGFTGRLLRFFKQQNIGYKFHDERIKLNEIAYNTKIILRPHQKQALEATKTKDIGIITAPPGSGKTIIGLKLIADKKQPALIIVHRKHLLEQWIERIQAFLGISKTEIGTIGQGRSKSGKKVTVALIQSLGKYLDKQTTDEFAKSFGTIIIDECHHIPAKTYRNTISKLHTYYQYGLTATPFRKGNNSKILTIYLGDTISKIEPTDIKQHKHAKIIIRPTMLDIPFNIKTDPFEILSKVLIHDTTRNNLILDDVIKELNSGRKAVIISERKEHIEILYLLLKKTHEVITLSGDDSEATRKLKWEILNKGNFQALITTGQLFGEGTDLQKVSCLFLVYPFSFKGKLIQYIGRVQRSELTPIIYDYRDHKIEYLNRLFLKRNIYYRELTKQLQLFDEPARQVNAPIRLTTIRKTIKVPIRKLDFCYGGVVFIYKVSELNAEIKCEIENLNFRPEFDVLKPYFSKVLGSNYISADIFAEFEGNLIVSQNAISIDIEKIDNEIIESVKFKFVYKSIVHKKSNKGLKNQILNLAELQSDNSENNFYNNEESLINDLLSNNKVIHYQHLKYLALKHDAKTMKVRFVLNPFSFIFLVTGKEQYHIILETLNTEEATYIWHLGKHQPLSIVSLSEINKDLEIIRNKGRQAFLETNPDNFSRITHEYTDDLRGFIIWKDRLEERLV